MDLESIQTLKKDALEQIDNAQNLNQLGELRIKFLGRRGLVTKLLKEIPTLLPKTRASLGQESNQAKREIEIRLREKRASCSLPTTTCSLPDVTLPGKMPPAGHLHIVSQAIEEIVDIFKRLGFTRVRYPEVDWDYYAFEALNMPKNHPARDEWETFFLTDKMLLTPHTSSGQVREMEKGSLPIRMINISRCDRRQSDVSHSPTFFQFEGLLIDKGINITHLIGVIDFFVKNFYGEERKTRLRPFNFLFTEPSFEVDVTCGLCGGKGCRFCKEGWLELGGAGMVHPNVLRAGRVDPNEYQGFAFGWGVERTYMMKAGINIDDIRLLYKNDMRFLKQF